MNEPRIFITSMGIISPIGQDICDTIDAIKKTTRGIKPLSLFPTGLMPSLPVGEVRFSSFTENIPRTHALAIAAAREAMKTSESAPDAIVIGTTTGGMPFTEELIKRGDIDPKQYGCHSTASVAEHIARHAGCRGPVLTVSTACSSGAVAVKIAVEMLRNGKVKQVLAGGADALCRLTYYGFHALQLVDEKEAHPFDRNRRGMSVGEGAAMFLLTAAESPPDNAIAELLGAGLSCDAYHPSTPHPDGKGAFCAMKAAISDAGISPSDIDYIHLHGTGTVDNDLSEARAIQILFGDGSVPPVSSLKGAVGHALAAAGAMGVVVSALSIAHSLMPANVGFHDHDPALGITPVEAPITANVTMALANSFGFGGNNAAVVVGRPRKQKGARTPIRDVRPVAFTVLGSACVTGAGNTEESIANMGNGGKIKGVVPGWLVMRHLDEKNVRRMKRLSRMVMSLAVSACKDGTAGPPGAVFFGTGWGGLSETYDFLTKLFASDERFTSPTDFIGSVHNAPAGHVAIQFNATGPNITATGSDCAFEQALYSANLLTRHSEDPILVIGADEYHDTLSPLFDASVALGGHPSDGGGALYLKPAASASSLQIYPSFISYSGINGQTILSLIDELGGAKRIRDQFGAILAGIPAAQKKKGKDQLDDFLSITGYPHPVIDYRQLIGEYASASAVAAVLAVSFVQAGFIPENVFHPQSVPLLGRGILVMGFGSYVTAMEIRP